MLNPAQSNDLYFVANGAGGHVFSATYEQHLANVAKWRAVENQVDVYTSSAVADADAPGRPAVATPQKAVATVKLKAER